MGRAALPTLALAAILPFLLLCQASPVFANTSCSDPSCLGCAADGVTCNQCEFGYGFDANKNCIRCRQDSCNTCQNTAANCIDCADDDDHSQYLKNGTCTKCNLPYPCTGCNNKGVCTKCINGYTLANAKCKMCPPNCEDCDANGKCKACSRFYGANSKGKCIKCKQAFCETCPGDRPERCTTCDEEGGEVWKSKAGVCINCANLMKDVNCARCYHDKGINPKTGKKECKECWSDADNTYPVYLNGTGKCTTCTANPFSTGCVACNAKGRCSDCNYGFVLNAQRKCQKCSVDGLCRVCTAPGKCTQCNDGFFISPLTKRCAACKGGKGCAKCDKAGSCLRCKEGFLYNPRTKVCNPCQSKWCAACTTSKCSKCKAGDSFQPTQDIWMAKGVCRACSDVDPSCQMCDHTTNKCKKCWDNFGLVSGRCQTCTDSNCNQCDGNVAVCKACNNGFNLAAGKCKMMK